MKEFRASNRQDESIIKFILNDKDEYILINGKDSTIFDRFMEFIKWLDDKTKETEEKEKEFRKKYGNNLIQRDEEGNVEDINTEAFVELSRMRMGVYRETKEILENIFGQDVFKKYFYVSYEINPDFVPDDECIYDFIEEVTPVLNEIFADREKRIELKYNRNRRGGKRNKYRTKEEIISGCMGK